MTISSQRKVLGSGLLFLLLKWYANNDREEEENSIAQNSRQNYSQVHECKPTEITSRVLIYAAL